MAGRFSVEALFQAKDNLSSVIAKINGNMGRLARTAKGSLGDLGALTDKFTSAFTKAAKVTSVAAVAAGGALALAAKPGADFEQAITAVGAVSLMTRGQIAELEKKALELGATTTFSATEVAQAMEMMGRAGFTNAETLAGVGGILAAAAAEGAGLAETASNVSNVLKGMGLAAAESGRVADVLTLASARTNSSISSLGESMKNVASTARTFNIPMEQTVAAVALLQDVGIDASEAGSAVNTMLTQMAAPSKEAQKKMKQLGISFKDAKGNMLPLTQVFAQFEKASKKSGGNMEQVAFFADLVGLRGQKAAVNLKDLFQQGKFGQLAKELEGAKGSAEAMAKLRMNNLKGDLEQLGGAVETLQIGLFNMQSGALRGLVQGLTKWVEVNGELVQSKAGEWLADLVSAVNNARFAFDLFTSGLRQGLSPGIELIKLLQGPTREVSDSLGTWPGIVQNIGRGAGAFVVFAVGIKAAQAALWVYTTAATAASAVTTFLAKETTVAALASSAAAVKSGILTAAEYAGAAAQWAKTAAINIGRIAMTQYTWATVASSAKIAIDTGLTWLRQAAQWAWNAATGAGTTIVRAFTAGTILNSAKTVIDTGLTWARQVAQWAINAALGAGSLVTTAWAVATGQATAATIAAEASLLPFLVTLGAVAAAITSLIVLYKSFSDLLAQTGGWAGLGEGLKSLASGDGFFNGINADMDRKAKEDAAKRNAAGGPQVVSPQDRTAAAINQTTNTTTTNKSELVIKDQSGKASFTKPPPKGGGISLAPSGGM